MTEDLISRSAAIDFIDAGHLVNPNEPRWSDNEVVNFLKSRPSAQPERKKGRWIKLYAGNYKCSVCGDWWGNDDNEMVEDFKYCPNCGADMRESDAK